ncbi:MAG: lysophospholipid acyltransferase family protein [Bdellovibrionia bacterium]
MISPESASDQKNNHFRSQNKRSSEEKKAGSKAQFTEPEKQRLFGDMERLDPVFAEKLSPFLEGLYRYYFRCEISGWENLPDQKALYVGNHNGLLTFEVLMLFHAWWKRFGNARRALGLAHNVAIDNPFFKWMLPRLGAIPADPQLALEALSRDYSLLVYPGGEKESFRPFSERKKVDFYQRKGFIRLALKAKVPIVPVVSIGAHESYVILHRGEELAEKLGLKRRFRLHGLPITFRSIFFFWCVSSGLFTFFPLLLAPSAFFSIFIPMPAQMTFKILPPIDPWALWQADASEEENLQRIYDHVLEKMQEVLTAEYAKRKYPLFG